MKLLIPSLFLVLLLTVAMPAHTVLAEDKSKPLVLFLAENPNCGWSDKIRKSLKELKKEYEPRVLFAEFDPSKPQESKRLAKELGVWTACADSLDYAPAVMIFSSERKLLRELTGPKTMQDYKVAIEKALAQSK